VPARLRVEFVGCLEREARPADEAAGGRRFGNSATSRRTCCTSRLRGSLRHREHVALGAWARASGTRMVTWRPIRLAESGGHHSIRRQRHARSHWWRRGRTASNGELVRRGLGGSPGFGNQNLVRPYALYMPKGPMNIGKAQGKARAMRGDRHPATPVRVLVAMAVVAGMIAPTCALAGGLKSVSLRDGCAQGRKEANTFRTNRPNTINDIVITDCYRRDRYRIVTEFTTFDSNGTMCYARGILSTSNGYWHWRQYAIRCH
jgi:hypothetical protein